MHNSRAPIDALFRVWQSPRHVRNEQFFYEGSREITALIDKAARRAGLSRGQSFEDFLTCVRCALAAGQMEEEYLRTVEKGYQTGSQGRRGIDRPKLQQRLF